MSSSDVENPNRTFRVEIYHSLVSVGLFPEEQKECHKVTRIGDLQYIDQHILKVSKVC